MDRVKEALFSIIGSDIQGAVFLDLFAGTGSVGIEALSRGAEFAQFVELNRRAIQVIRDNLDRTGLADCATVVRRDAIRLLARRPSATLIYLHCAATVQRHWRKSLGRSSRMPPGVTRIPVSLCKLIQENSTAGNVFRIWHWPTSEHTAAPCCCSIACRWRRGR